ncbi:phosphate ABC transporter substrate-binding protein PstS family protein [Acaryochloris marina]|uniref:Phosphate transporter binding protein n=1 Tax=Acaryochloris marina (strain MBIC 11017) TaxID=329726 RepID=A8ZQJ2_ACAM1|nr:phosphate ABC transporter substrate-binding protein PstS family protein [Acaryochloris marina]ABW33278.1 phosphate transporter binding protein [Acaryochloris marina MBIC11017]
MVCCLNPDCEKPLNQDSSKFCQSCGTELIPLLRHRFKIIKPLGRGGFGKTYLAEDADKLNEKCVVKQLVYQAQGSHANKLVVELFMREAEQLQQLWENPQIPSLFAYFEEGGYLYLVQQYVKGQDLLKELKEQGCFDDQKILALLKDLLPVFSAIHSRKVIHRDIKPENIMRRENDGRLILIDFGVSKQLSKSIVSMAGTMVGSLGYAAPEQMESGIAQPNSDLYSLGASCFHLMTGINPWSLWRKQGYGWLAEWRKHLQQPICSELGTVLDKLLQLEVEDRYQSADEVLADLDGAKAQAEAEQLQRYEAEFSNAVQSAYPLEAHVRDGLKQFQQSLGLADAEVDQIEQPILKQAEAKRQERIKQQAEVQRQAQQKQHEKKLKQEADQREEKAAILSTKNLVSQTPRSTRKTLISVGLFGLIVVPLSLYGLSTISRDPDPIPTVSSDLSTTSINLKGSIAIDGSSSVFPISEVIAEEFQSVNKDVKITVGISGTGGGFKKFCSGETEISDASRPIKQREIALCAKNNIEYIELPVAYDVLSVVVHKDNDWADCMTTNELKTAWSKSAQGNISKWNQVNPNYPDVPLTLYGPGTDSGTFDYFNEAITGEEGSRGDFATSEDNNTIVRGVSGDKNAMGYLGYVYYEENKDSLKAVQIDDGDGCIAPSDETISKGTYSPLARPMFIYVSKVAIDRPEVKSFIEFYLNPKNRQLVANVGYIPLSDEIYAKALARFQEGKTGTVFPNGKTNNVELTDVL